MLRLSTCSSPFRLLFRSNPVRSTQSRFPSEPDWTFRFKSSISTTSVGTAYEHLVARTLKHRLHLNPIVHTGKAGDRGVDLVARWRIGRPVGNDRLGRLIDSNVLVQCKGIGLYVAAGEEERDSPLFKLRMTYLDPTTDSKCSTTDDLDDKPRKPKVRKAGSAQIRALDGTFARLKDWVLARWFAQLEMDDYTTQDDEPTTERETTRKSKKKNQTTEVASQDRPIIGMLATPVGATSALLEALGSTSTPLVFITIVPAADSAGPGYIKQMLWNSAAASAGLDKFIPIPLNTEHRQPQSDDPSSPSTIVQEEILLALRDDPMSVLRETGWSIHKPAA